MVKKLILFIAIITFGMSPCSDKGCTDPNASNYDAIAGQNDGSCVYKSPNVKTGRITSDETNLAYNKFPNSDAYILQINNCLFDNVEVYANDCTVPTVDQGLSESLVTVGDGSTLDIIDLFSWTLARYRNEL